MRQISLDSWMECAQSTIKDICSMSENDHRRGRYLPIACILARAMDSKDFWANDGLADEIAELSEKDQLRVQRTLEQLMDIADPDSMFAREVSRKIKHASAKEIDAAERESAEERLLACAG